MHIVPVIMAAGKGERLWPYSRVQNPKQFIRLSDGQTLFQKALIRASALECSFIVVAITQELYQQARREAVELGSQCKRVNWMVGPFNNGTTHIALAASQLNPSATILLMASDHDIDPIDQWVLDAEMICSLADQRNEIALMGIKPWTVSTQFGYITYKRDCDYDGRVHIVDSFLEKPLEATARTLIQSGALWNSGITAFPAQRFMADVHKYIPISASERYLISGNSEECTYMMDGPAVKMSSIEYDVFEHLDDLTVLEARFKWNDLGVFDQMIDKLTPAEHVVEVSCTMNSVCAPKNKVVGLIGVHDLIVIDTEDALLISARGQTHQVRDLVDNLKNDKSAPDVLTELKVVDRPWGSYKILEELPFVKVKRLTIKPGKAISLQYHTSRDERWTVLKGKAVVTIGSTFKQDSLQRIELNVGQYADIPAGFVHSLANEGSEDLVVLEVQNGSYLGEDDIVRISDPNI
jgi:mannose-1-phosphate guanylyltransferase/mannose-6-phosphate isomerase